MSEAATQDPVYARLLKAALECFLSDEYHRVTTRMIAEKANTNISMIRYYFGNKEGLYEEMTRDTLKPILDILDSRMLFEVGGFAEYLRFYYDTMRKHPEFPKLMLKVLALSQGRAGASFCNCWSAAAAAARAGWNSSRPPGRSTSRSTPTSRAWPSSAFP